MLLHPADPGGIRNHARLQHDGAHKVRLGLSGHPLEFDDMCDSIKLGVVTHGRRTRTRNLIAANYTAKMIPGAKLSIYQGVGHSPSSRATPRFNPNLAPSWQRPQERELRFAFPFHYPRPPVHTLDGEAGGPYSDSTLSVSI